MARRRIVALVFAIALFALAACGSGNKAPSDKPGSQHPGSGQFPTVNVTISDIAIISDTRQFNSGSATPQAGGAGGGVNPSVPTYHFIVKNTGKSPHEFMIAPPLSSIQNQSVEQDRALALVDKQNIAPGATVTFDLSMSAPAGNLEMASHMDDDYAHGLFLPITIV